MTTYQEVCKRRLDSEGLVFFCEQENNSSKVFVFVHA